ncbi:hypothetical protein JXA80_08240 [bacterium]|nr:hypothetical protein [candidate division CSSED10-310 bacterium]
MESMVYMLGAAGLVGGLGLGWFIRHSLLNRQLNQSRKQLEEVRALQLNVEHELSSLRQKIIQQSGHQEKLSSEIEKAQSKTHERSREFDELKSRIDQLSEDNETLQEQITYLESERTSYQQYREQTATQIETISSENLILKERIESLQNRRPPETPAPTAFGGLPRVRRINPEEYRELSRQEASETIRSEKDETSRLKTNQSKSTDRVNKRSNDDTGSRPPTPPPPPKTAPSTETMTPKSTIIPQITPNAASLSRFEPDNEGDEPDFDFGPVRLIEKERMIDLDADPEFNEQTNDFDMTALPDMPEPPDLKDMAPSSLFDAMEDSDSVDLDMENSDGVALDDDRFALEPDEPSNEKEPGFVTIPASNFTDGYTNGYDEENEEQSLMETITWKRGDDVDDPDTTFPGETQDSAFTDTVQQPLVGQMDTRYSESAPPPIPRALPSREPSDESARHRAVRRPAGWDPMSELSPITGKSHPPSDTGDKLKKVKKKKKPNTVRIDTSSSDIIDSFKRELGLPE